MPRLADLSVVVVSLVGGDALARCIERLPLTEIECVVVLKDAASDPALWARRYPRARFLPGRDEPLSLRRKRAVAASAGAIVGLIEDNSWPERGWCDAALAALADGKVVAAAGPVAMAPFLSDRCRALAWITLGAFVPGAGDPPADTLPGNALAVRRAALGEVTFDPDSIVVSGKVAFVAGMKVTFSACDAAGPALASRFHHGRMRGAAKPARSLGARIGTIARAVARPFALVARDIRRILRTDRGSLSLTLVMWLALMETAYVIGEAKGALSGGADPGTR